MTSPLIIESPKGRLRVVFTWCGDRYQHRVVNAAGQELSSIEGTAEQAWPPSPPIQQLSAERINDQDVILGLGAAGIGHWSISVVPTNTDNGDAIRFDLACRCRQPPEHLASSYGGSLEALAFTASAHTIVERTASHVVVRPQSRAAELTQQWSYTVS